MTAQGLPTCSCGSTDFDEVRILLPVISTRQVDWTTEQPKTVEQPTPMEFWVILCKRCSQATFRTKPSGKENFIRK